MPRHVVCPYCFEGFKPAHLQFRCIEPNGCDPVEDKLLGDYLRRNPPPVLQRIVPPDAPLWGPPRHGTCSCGTRTSKAVCPLCHNELPSQFANTTPFTVAMIGAKEVGKSHYIAVLIHELMHNLGHRFDATLNALDDQTRRRYREDFRRYVYENHEVIPATRSARAQLDVRYPLVYRLSIARKGFFRRKLKVSSMVFFDTAGEDLRHDDTMATENRYIANSQGLIFLLDPLQIPSVRQELGLPALAPGEGTDPRDIVMRAGEMIRKVRGLNPADRIPTPVALAFSKIDEVRSLLEPDSVINQASTHEGWFDLSDFGAIDESIRSHVKRWLGPDFHTTLEHNYKHFAYFGLSALGGRPEEGMLPKGVQAFRVADPFLWLLWKARMIDGKKAKTR